jgi:hypothetical protein
MKKTLLIVLLILAGCASQSNYTWYRDGATKADIERDFSACRYDMTKYGHVDSNGHAGRATVEEYYRKNEVWRECLTSKGYTYIPLDEAMQRRDLRAQNQHGK